MKISAKQLALVLYDKTEGKEGKEIKTYLSKFVRFLGKRHLIKDSEKIMAEYKKIFLNRQNMIEVVAHTKFGLTKSVKEDVMEALKKVVGGRKKILFKEVTDDNMTGGVKVYFQDKLMDFSIDTQISNLKHKLEK